MIKPRKRVGQHFLEPAWVRKLLDVVRPRHDDVFLEIGPGPGALTRALAPLVHRIVAVEIDRDLAAHLAASAPPNVQIVRADFLEADLPALLATDGSPGSGLSATPDPTVTPDPRPRLDPIRAIRVVGNLPYNISSPILFRLLALSNGGRFLTDATLTLQREVADRVVARPGTRDYGVLSILAQFHSVATRSLLLPPGAFRPPPKVSSAVVRLRFTPPRIATSSPALLEQMVRAMFMHRRKTLANALTDFAGARGVGAGEALAKADIDRSRRPETLDLSEIGRLADVFASGPRPDVL